jgi:hypothetical protein
MKKQFYLPKQEARLVIWFNNFSERVKNKYAAIFGISNSDADKLVEYAAFFSFLVSYAEMVRTFSEGLTKYKNGFKKSSLNTPLGSVPQLSITIPATIPTEAAMLKMISNTVNTIKAHPKYKTNMGEDLGIEGAVIEFKHDEYKPECEATAKRGVVDVDFIKKGVDAMNIYGNAIGSANAGEWVFLGTRTQSPYRDTRPLAVAGKPEHRRYHTRGVIADKEIGQQSDEISVTFGG